MKIERLLAITILLLNRRKATAKELAEDFEVSQRTIYRDIDTLNGAGIPVVSSQGYEGGFCIPDNYKLSRQLLTYNDMVAILTTLKGINNSLENRDIERIIEKITSLIPTDKKESYKKQSESFIIDISPWGRSRHNKDVMKFIHRGISESRQLHFNYVGAKGKKSSRMVEPHSLVFKGFNWYLLAFCYLRQNFRVFRLTRMREARLTKKYFIRRDVDPDSHFQPLTDPDLMIQMVLKFSKKIQIQIEEMFDAENLHYNEDGSIQAAITIPDDGWIHSFILSFGEDVEILAPGSWRRKIKNQIKKLTDIYWDG